MISRRTSRRTSRKTSKKARKTSRKTSKKARKTSRKTSRSRNDVSEKNSLSQKEISFSCKLQKSKKINKFSRNILWIGIKKYLDCGFSCKEISKHIEEKYVDDEKADLKKPGLSDIDSERIVELVSKNKKREYEKELNSPKNFYRIMGSFYSFTERFDEINKKFIVCCIEKNEKLKELILKRIVKLFCLPSSFTWNNLKEEIKDNSDDMNIFYGALVDMTNCPKSNVRKNLSRPSYIRNISNETYKINIRSPLIKCHKNISTKKEINIITADTYYNIKDTFFSKILKKYKKTGIAGPSGSTVITIDLVFKIFGLKNDLKNRMLLLGCLIADYVPFYHTITEILISFSNEFNLNYTLDKDPVDFTMEIIKNYL